MHGGPRITREPLFYELLSRYIVVNAPYVLGLETFYNPWTLGYECWWFHKRKPISVIRGLQ